MQSYTCGRMYMMLVWTIVVPWRKTPDITIQNTIIMVLVTLLQQWIAVYVLIEMKTKQIVIVYTVIFSQHFRLFFGITFHIVHVNCKCRWTYFARVIIHHLLQLKINQYSNYISKLKLLLKAIHYFIFFQAKTWVFHWKVAYVIRTDFSNFFDQQLFSFDFKHFKQ